jgi:tetratricopeptide (TPR) repeat protein/peroxiredoxin
VSRSPAGSAASVADRTRFNDAWSAIYELIDQGHSWSGRERDCCFLNTGGPRFANISGSSGLDYPDDGRGLARCDWDFDGRVDFWVTNRTGPRVRFLKNRTDGRGRFLALRLVGTTCNRDAIGARVEVVLAGNRNEKLIRTLRAGEGFIGQSTKWLHFGLADAGEIEKVIVRWPQRNAVETFTELLPNRHYTLVQGSGRAEMWGPPESKTLEPSPSPSPPAADRARTWIVGRVPLPAAHYRGMDGRLVDIDTHRGRPLLVNLWSQSCRPCLEELAEWSQASPPLADSGLKIVAINVDGLDDRASAETASSLAASAAEIATSSAASPVTRGWATRELVETFEIVHRAAIDRQNTLPVPSSFLLDASGRVAAIYKGRVSTERLRSDVRLLAAPASEQRAAAVPFAGRWAGPPFMPNPRPVLARFVKARLTKQAQDYCRRLLAECDADPVGLAGDAGRATALKADIYRMLGALLLDEGKNDDAVEALAHLQRLAPENVALHVETARRLTECRLYDAAAAHLNTAIRARPGDLELSYNMALVEVNRRRFTEAAGELNRILRNQPENDEVRYHLAGALLQSGDARAAIDHYAAVAARHPDSPAANNLAWILATHSDGSIRDGARAVGLAEEVCRRTKRQDVSALDTLAASYAEASRFEEAVETVELAVKQAQGDAKRVESLNKRLELYRAKRPLRDDGRL